MSGLGMEELQKRVKESNERRTRCHFCGNKATKHCQECRAHFCDGCWDQAHPKSNLASQMHNCTRLVVPPSIGEITNSFDVVQPEIEIKYRRITEGFESQVQICPTLLNERELNATLIRFQLILGESSAPQILQHKRWTTISPSEFDKNNTRVEYKILSREEDFEGTISKEKIEEGTTNPDATGNLIGTTTVILGASAVAVALVKDSGVVEKAKEYVPRVVNDARQYIQNVSIQV
eukprot:TRINITY_DN626_c0_g1_i4.p1 TRINITY_DN626_c0_g1~~TRINITY_DN626_c0_g1_i4.p1  ORF type:complete len:235 (+),score=50.42 TRINITY_DN626_c0_g1_i4:96-800(+)